MGYVTTGRSINRVFDMGFQEYRRMSLGKPIDKRFPLPYLMYGNQSKPQLVGGSSTKALDDLTHNGYGLENPVINRAYAKAFDKFVEKAKSSLEISMGENLGESRKTLEMIATRSEDLVKLAKRVSPEEYRRKSRRKLKWRRVIKHPAGWWLEYHLAWRPIIQDIYNGCRMLSEPVWELTPIMTTGRETERIDRSHPFNGRFAEIDISEIVAHVAIRGNARVTNPNAYLINRMGLINPAQVAWQLTPLSMFVDWVWNVSSFLGSYTDQCGWSLERGQVAMMDRCKNTYHIDNWYDSPENNLRPSNAWRFQRGVGMSSLPIPDFASRRGSGIKSITRGITAIAVLIGLLGK